MKKETVDWRLLEYRRDGTTFELSVFCPSTGVDGAGGITNGKEISTDKSGFHSVYDDINGDHEHGTSIGAQLFHVEAMYVYALRLNYGLRCIVVSSEGCEKARVCGRVDVACKISRAEVAITHLLFLSGRIKPKHH